MKPHADPSENMLWAFDDSWAVTLPAGRRHALAALCLHGQPFGFTREMCEAIRELVRRLGAVDPDLGHVFMIGEALETADRIEALLPPEDAT